MTLHSKRKHQQSKKTTYRMKISIFKLTMYLIRVNTPNRFLKKNLLQLNSKKNKIKIKKWTKEPNRHFSKEDMRGQCGLFRGKRKPKLFLSCETLFRLKF